jgi:uncharacterized cupin superfamily protein
MPKIDLEAIPQSNATGYPEPYAAAVAGRHYRRLAPVAGLTEMGASHVVLDPGAWSSQRHWHAAEDELLVMLSGEAVLVENEGETVVRPGDVLAWAKGVANGHHLQNRSGAPCSFIAISAGDRAADRGEYPDIDMTFGKGGYFRRDGTAYETRRPA